MKSILMSIQSKWLYEILDGEKTVELRKRFPKDYRGWVYLYCTKGKPYLTKIYGEWCLTRYGCEESQSGNVRTINGKVVGRVWVDNVVKTITNEPDITYRYVPTKELGLTKDELLKYLGNSKTLYGIYFSKLEIFDKPKELGEFYYYKKRLIDCGMDCPPYFDEVKTQVSKAPQSWQYIYIEEV